MATKDNDAAQAHEVDTYAQRKNYAKGLVDLSLLTANAHQLAKQYSEAGGFNFACLLLSGSIILQVKLLIYLSLLRSPFLFKWFVCVASFIKGLSVPL